MQRGQIYNRARATQVRDFTGLRWNNITPTDVDGLIDFQNNAFVLFELKRKGTEIPFGQELAIERVAALMNTQKPTIAFLAEHEDDGATIFAAGAVVVSYFWEGTWWDDGRGLTLKESIDSFLAKRRIA